MRRLFVTTSVVALLGLPAFAGGVAEPVMEPNVVVQDTTSSASGIVVPLLLLLLIAAAVAGSDGSSPPIGPSDRRIKTDVEWVGMAKGLPPTERSKRPRKRRTGHPVQSAKLAQTARPWPG